MTDPRHLARRYRRARLLRWCCLAAVVFALSCVMLLLFDITRKGIGGFSVQRLSLSVRFDPELLGLEGLEPRPEDLQFADFPALLSASLAALIPGAGGDGSQWTALLDDNADFLLYERLLADPRLLGTEVGFELPLSGWAERYLDEAGSKQYATLVEAELLSTLDWLVEQGLVHLRFNDTFFSAGDSRSPSSAGIHSALLGSLYTLLVCFLLSFPVGVATAIYFEEFAPSNRWITLLEININNLAAVPSIIFGLLGLAVVINFFGLPRSVPLVGGIVLALMTLPTIIIASRSAIRAVPPSVREAALALGASRMEVIVHHVVPLALPGMLTGAIIGMAQALGETAPLLLIGMVAFVVSPPTGLMDPAAVLPVQIFLWADSPERGFIELTSAAIMVLLAFLGVMNIGAVLLRRRFERRW